MTASYTFTVEGTSHTNVLDEAHRVARTYWHPTPYRIVATSADGNYFRGMDDSRLARVEVTTRALEPVAS